LMDHNRSLRNKAWKVVVDYVGRSVRGLGCIHKKDFNGITRPCVEREVPFVRRDMFQELRQIAFEDRQQVLALP